MNLAPAARRAGLDSAPARTGRISHRLAGRRIGLLRKSLDSISDELAIYAGIDASPEELEEVLKIIQDFDPAGLGARTLQECLLIQIRRKEAQRPMPSPPQYYIEEDILTQCYEEFTRKHWDKIMQKLGISEDTLQQAVKEICKLNPRPVPRSAKPSARTCSRLCPTSW